MTIAYVIDHNERGEATLSAWDLESGDRLSERTIVSGRKLQQRQQARESQVRHFLTSICSCQFLFKFLNFLGGVRCIICECRPTCEDFFSNKLQQFAVFSKIGFTIIILTDPLMRLHQLADLSRVISANTYLVFFNFNFNVFSAALSTGPATPYKLVPSSNSVWTPGSPGESAVCQSSRHNVRSVSCRRL